MSDVTIRAARIPDLPEVAEMAGGLVRLHHTTDPGRFFLPDRVEEGYASWLRRELRRKGAVVLVAELAGKLVGYAYGSMESRNWNALLDEHGAVHDVFVLEGARRGGVAKKLVDAMLTELQALGAARVLLSTMVQNEAAQKLFEACGFRPTMLEMTRNR